MISSFFSSKVILNLGKMSIRPKSNGTSSISAQAKRILSFLPFRIIVAFLRIYGTPLPETPFISKISSSGFCLRPMALPVSSGIIVISAPESIYIITSTVWFLYSRTTSATGLRTVPLIIEDSFR